MIKYVEIIICDMREACQVGDFFNCYDRVVDFHGYVDKKMYMCMLITIGLEL